MVMIHQEFAACSTVKVAVLTPSVTVTVAVRLGAFEVPLALVAIFTLVPSKVGVHQVWLLVTLKVR
jgi:hypothetical protein